MRIPGFLWDLPLTFADGAPPALQLEYEAPVPVRETAGLRTLAHRIWPAP
ncbi:MAG TPA: hypothetical protein VG106_00335 [Vicinamibacterales bacterium]|nr:hypothetical protein [Vicinamibacterales bacterium]